MDATWEKNRLTSLKIKSASDNVFPLKVPGDAIEVRKRGKGVPIENGFVSIETKGGEQVELDILYAR